MKKPIEKSRKGPFIKAMLGTSFHNMGKKITSAHAGTCIRIIGRGFGKKSKAVNVFFDGIQEKIFAYPFSDSEALVLCPMPKRPTSSIFLQVNSTQSNTKRFSVKRPLDNKEPVGSQTKKYFDAVDKVASLVSGFGRAIAKYTPYEKELIDAAVNLDNTRSVKPMLLETLMLWAPIQEKYDFTPLKTIKTMDNIFYQTKLAEGLDNFTENLFGSKGYIANYIGPKNMSGDILFSQASPLQTKMANIKTDSSGESSSTWGSFLDIGGFIIHEISKLMEGGENIAKILKPSAEVTGEVSVGVGAGGGVDTEFDPGQWPSALAKFVDIIAQIMMKVGAGIKSGEAGEKINKLEAKGDRQEANIVDIKTGQSELKIQIESSITKIDKLEVKEDKISEKLDKIELKGDKMEGKADKLAEAISSIEEKGDRAESKLDVVGEKLDMIETKNDHIEEKIDRAEAKIDFVELKLDKIEEKNDREEEKLDKLEEKLDKLEEKNDMEEEKLDKIEEKLDKIEEKNDKEEQKLDELESKADKIEVKLDKIEGKNDKQEGKLDKIEGKLDKIEVKNDKEEEKLDKIEAKVDHQPPILISHEASVAQQRDILDKVTAVVITLKATDNKVYIRFCINEERDQLDNLINWSPWIDFGRPTGAIVLIDVSIDLQYLEGSDTNITAIATTRDALGKIYTRTFNGLDHNKLIDVGDWTDWDDFIGQP